MTQEPSTDPRRADERPVGDLLAAERRDRLRATNEQSWGRFFLGLLVNTVVIILIVGAVFFVISRLAK